MLQAIVFDYDGVLADTERLHLEAFRRTLAGHDLVLGEAEYFDSYLGLDDEGVFRAVAQQRGRAWSDAAVRALVDRKARCFREVSASTSVLFPGVPDRLRAWSRAVSLAIASGSLREEIELVLDAASLRDTIPVIVAAGETAKGKPAPDPYLRAMELLAASRPGTPLEPARCLAVEDSPWGIDSARAAGMRVIAVTTSYPAERLAGADAIFAGLATVDLDLLQGLVG